MTAVDHHAVLAAIEDVMMAAFNSAGTTYSSAGTPAPEWGPLATLVMDRLAPARQMLATALRDAPANAKRCPHCSSPALVLLRTQSLKFCADCRQQIPWPLDSGQPPVIEGGRENPKTEASHQ